MLGYIVLVCAIRQILSCTVDGTHADCRSMNLLSIPSDLPPSITYLSVRDNNLAELNPGDLQFYPNVTELDLSYNRLSRIQSGVFMGMSSIERLELVGNNLNYCNDSLPKNAFDGLVSLLKLLLYETTSHENCQAYPYGVFESTPKLEYLAFSVMTDVLHPVADDIVNLKNLHTLEFRRYDFSISNDSLATLVNSSVNSIVFTHVTMLQIQDGSFKDIPSLETIVCNDVWGITPEALLTSLEDTGSTHIKRLHLNINSMATSVADLPGDLFCNDVGVNLQRISLTLVTVYGRVSLDFLDCLTNVQEITLMYSDPANFKVTVSSSVVLTILELFGDFYHLQVLNLYKLGHTEPDFYADFIHCRVRENPGCSREVDDFFAPKYKYIPRYNKEPTEYPRETESNYAPIGINITSISITDMFLGYIPTESPTIIELDPNNNVQTIDWHKFPLIRSTGWMDTNSGISGLFHLRHLNLSDNGLTSLPRLLNTHILEILNISSNRLGLLDEWTIRNEFFWNSPYLIQLDMSMNDLAELPLELLDQWPVIEILCLANNRLTTLGFLSHGPGEQLTFVDVSDNSITKLDQTDLDALDEYEGTQFVIDLQDNPFFCACELHDTATWLKSTTLNVLNKDMYRCNNDQRATVTGLDINKLVYGLGATRTRRHRTRW